MATISSVDLFVAAVRHQAAAMAQVPDSEKSAALAVTAKLTNSLTMAITHAASFAVRGVASCVKVRRGATVALAKKVDMSKPTKEWLMCQPVSGKGRHSTLFWTSSLDSC